MMAKTRISNIRQTDKKASHEKPKRTNIQKAVTKTNSRKTKMSNNPILDFNPVK